MSTIVSVSEARDVIAREWETLQHAFPDASDPNFLLLVNLLIDDSKSIENYGNTDSVILGHNEYLDRLSSAPGKVLVRTRLLNGKLLSPDYLQPSEAPRMSKANYRPLYGTPLYHQSKLFLGEVRATVEEFLAKGIDVHTLNAIFTDGKNEAAGQFCETAADVKTVMTAMMETRRHIFRAMGVEDGHHTDFLQIFANMGIPEQGRSVLRRRANDISQSFADLSEVASNASLSSEAFQRTLCGGILPPKKAEKDRDSQTVVLPKSALKGSPEKPKGIQEIGHKGVHAFQVLVTLLKNLVFRRG